MLSTGTNDSPERTLPASPLERSEPSASVITNAQTVTRRVRAGKAQPQPKLRMHPSPESPRRERRDARRAGSRCPESPVARRGNIAGLRDSDLAPRGRTSGPDASIEVVPSHRIHGPLVGGVLTPMSPPPCALHLGDRSSPSPTGPNRFASATTSLRSVSYRLDTPTSPAVARRWRRFVSGSEEPSLLVGSSVCPADAGSDRSPAATLPPRLEPHRPCQTGDPAYRRNASMPIGLASQHGFASGVFRGTPKDLLGTLDPMRNTPRMFDAGVDSRRAKRVATLIAEQDVAAWRRRPSSAGWRFLRAGTRARRSPAALGGLDASADADRRLRNRRLYTTAHPHDIEAGGVATTAPAGASHEMSGMR